MTELSKWNIPFCDASFRLIKVKGCICFSLPSGVWPQKWGSYTRKHMGNWMITSIPHRSCISHSALINLVHAFYGDGSSAGTGKLDIFLSGHEWFLFTFVDDIIQNHQWDLGLYSLRRHCLISIGIPIINLRRSIDRLRFIMGIPLPIRQRLFSEQRPWKGTNDISTVISTDISKDLKALHLRVKNSPGLVPLFQSLQATMLSFLDLCLSPYGQMASTKTHNIFMSCVKSLQMPVHHTANRFKEMCILSLKSIISQSLSSIK